QYRRPGQSARPPWLYSPAQAVRPYSPASLLALEKGPPSSVTSADGSSSPFAIASSAASMISSTCGSSPAGAASAATPSTCLLTAGRKTVSASSAFCACVGSCLWPILFAVRNSSNPALISLLPSAQIWFPCLRNSALVSDSTVDVVPLPLPHPAAISANASTPNTAPANLFFNCPSLAGLF